MLTLTTEIYHLIIVTFFCSVLWIPYVTERFFRIGIKETCGYGDKNIHIPKWASRAKLAHLNLIENLPLFAILIIVVTLLENNNEQTAAGSIIFFYIAVFYIISFIYLGFLI